MSTITTQMGNITGFKLPASAPPDPEAWERLVGQKHVNARLCLLPEAKLRKGALLTSTVIQAALAALLIILPMFFPQTLVTKIYEVTPLSAPDTSVALPPKKQPEIRPKVQ